MNAELRKEEKGKENRRSSMNVEVGSQQLDVDRGYEKILKLCQELRKENTYLKQENKHLSLQLQCLSKGEEEKLINPNSYSAIQNSIRSQLQNQFNQYKRQIHTHYQSKLKQTLSHFNMYSQLPTNNHSQINTLLSQFHSHPNPILALRQLVKSEQTLEKLKINKEFPFMGLSKQVMGEKLRQMKRMTDLLLNQYKEQLESLKREIKNKSEKMCKQLSRCMEKSVGDEGILKRRLTIGCPLVPSSTKGKSNNVTPKNDHVNRKGEMNPNKRKRIQSSGEIKRKKK